MPPTLTAHPELGMAVHEMTRHPLSALWPDMPEDEFSDLVTSIGKSLMPRPTIYYFDNMVLDGWHRYMALKASGKDPAKEAHWVECMKNPAEFVIQANAMRRHLSKEQRLACILSCREWAPAGRPTRKKNGKKNADAAPPPVTNENIASTEGVSVGTVVNTKTAIRGGLGEEVRSGEMSPAAAAEQVRAANRPEKPAEYLPPGDDSPEAVHAHLLDEAGPDGPAYFWHLHDGGDSEHSHEEEAKEADFTAPPSADQPLVPTATVEAPAAEELPAAEEPEPPAEPETIAEAIGKRPSRIQELQAELATKNQTIFEQDQELGELRVQIQFYRDQESPETSVKAATLNARMQEIRGFTSRVNQLNHDVTEGQRLLGLMEKDVKAKDEEIAQLKKELRVDTP